MFLACLSVIVCCRLTLYLYVAYVANKLFHFSTDVSARVFAFLGMVLITSVCLFYLKSYLNCVAGLSLAQRHSHFVTL